MSQTVDMKMSPEQASELRAEYLSIVDGMQDYLEFRKEQGDTTLPVSIPLKSVAYPRVVARSKTTGLVSKSQDVKSAFERLVEIATQIKNCEQCPLCRERTNTVPGQGAPTPELMFVGEGPGANEDAQGLAFVGRAGNLLTKMIEAMGLSRDEVFITNIVKCRPPGNRNPMPDEMESCMPYLREQIGVLQPTVIVALGSVAVKGLLNVTTGITKLRGTWHSFEGIDMMPTYHPAYLLRNPPKKKEVWEDLKEVLRRLGKPVPDTR